MQDVVIYLHEHFRSKSMILLVNFELSSDKYTKHTSLIQHTCISLKQTAFPYIAFLMANSKPSQKIRHHLKASFTVKSTSTQSFKHFISARLTSIASKVCELSITHNENLKSKSNLALTTLSETKNAFNQQRLPHEGQIHPVVNGMSEAARVLIPV